MAFGPEDSAAGIGLVFVSFLFWGAHPICRRVAKEADGAAYALVCFLGECFFALVFCSVFGALTCPSSSSCSWLTTSVGWDEISTTLSARGKILWIILGGSLVGCGDFFLPIVMSYVPATIAFPIVAGGCLSAGTFMNFLIVGNAKPIALFTGLFAAIFAVLAMAKGQSKRVGPKTVSTVQGIIEMTDLTEKASPPTAAEDDGGNEEQSDRGGRKWVFLLVLMGLNNSLWSPLSSLGQSGEDGIGGPYAAYFALELGRVGIQPFIHVLYNGCCRKRLSKRSSIELAKELTRRDFLYAFLNGMLISVGYFFYFLSSVVVNKAAAFAISNCAPLVTVLLGVCVLREVDTYSSASKKLIALSILLYTAAIALLTFSSLPE
jgi:uncharacterized membrane protein